MSIEKEDKSKSLLSFEQEEALWLDCKRGDESARDALILTYRPIVFWLAKQFRVPYQTYPDLIQEGMMALICSVDRFDVSRKNRFSTYACYRIRGQMVNFLQRVEGRAPHPVEDEWLEKENNLHQDEDRMEWILTLEEGVRQLPQKEADVVEALLIQGRSARDVAVEGNLDISYIYKLQKKALARLKSWFEFADAKAEL